MLARVSTLLSTVGCPNRPFTAGKGGRGRGSPQLPSMEAIRAVSSPQTKAPPPRTTLSFSRRPLPSTSSPRMPWRSASAMAVVTLRTARPYSSRM